MIATVFNKTYNVVLSKEETLRWHTPEGRASFTQYLNTKAAMHRCDRVSVELHDRVYPVNWRVIE